MADRQAERQAIHARHERRREHGDRCDLDDRGDDSHLTEREQQVIAHRAEGHSVAETGRCFC